MLDAMTQVQAQERLEVISDMVVASGAAKKHDTRNHIRQLERHLGASRPAEEADLQAIGIKVVKNG